MKKTKMLPPIHFVPYEEIQFNELLETLNPNHLPHILSCGAGIDSLSLLIEYAENPDSRDFPLCNLIVVHAVVGGESAETKRLMEEVIFPLCRRENIWFIQAIRNGQLEEDGITILSSTRQPTTFYTRGDYCLFTYLIMSGTVPQRGGSGRLCTIKFKGWVIDLIAIALFKDSPRQRYIGFNADESKRAEAEWAYQSDDTAPYYLIGYNADETRRLKDKCFGQPYEYEIGFNADETGRVKESECKERRQIFRFPLIEMGFGRQWCENRVNAFATWWTKGVITQGRKSFCLNCCPFPECNGKKREKGNNTHGDLREDWINEPQYGGEAAFVEHISLGLNTAQPLYTKQLVIEVLEETHNYSAIAYYNRLLDGEYWVDLVVPQLHKMNSPAAQKQADELLAGKTWAVYCVRRIFAHDVKMPFRQTRILFQGKEADSYKFLVDLAARYDRIPEVVALSYRFWTIERPQAEGKKKVPRPYVEEFFVMLPATVYDKQRITDEQYNLRWIAITGSLPHIKGVNDESTIAQPSTRSVRQSRIRAMLR